MRQCPNQLCGKLIDTDQASSRIGVYLGVYCGYCNKEWCMQCWLPSHPGVACEQYAQLKQQWMKFVKSQDHISEEVIIENI